MNATPTKTKNGQRKNAGRPPLKAKVTRASPQGQVIARQLLVRAFCLLLVLLSAASTVSDPVQALVERSFGGVASASLEAQTRASLLRRVATNTDAVRALHTKDIELLFGAPDLVRREGPVHSLHYTSAECALDVYYKEAQLRPAYVEYRLRGDGGGEAHQSCLQSLFVGARFNAAVPPAPTVAATAPDGRV